ARRRTAAHERGARRPQWTAQSGPGRLGWRWRSGLDHRFRRRSDLVREHGLTGEAGDDSARQAPQDEDLRTQSNSDRRRLERRRPARLAGWRGGWLLLLL